VRGTVLFLRGRSRELVDKIEREMETAAGEERYEDAARLRDRIAAVERTIEGQQIVTEGGVDRDVFALARQGGEVDVQALHVREGRVIGARGFSFSNVQLDDGEVMSSFLGQFYGAGAGHAPPREVLTSAPHDDDGALVALWRERFDQVVEIRTPQRGASRRLLEIAERNASLSLASRLAARESIDTAIDELAERCGLAVRPVRIECYDVSNLQGTLAVGSRVVFEHGEPVTQDYRRYRMREAAAGDDYACLREMLDRRLKRVATEPLPDLLMVDGGRGQLGVAMAALADAGLASRCSGSRRSATSCRRRCASSAAAGSRRSGSSAPGARIRSSSRRAAAACCCSSACATSPTASPSNTSAICVRGLNMTSILEELPGIGPGKRRALLKTLGSLRAVRSASEEALVAVPGISAKDAQAIRRFFEVFEAAGDAQVDGRAAPTEGSAIGDESR
jgi:excinuclease ABC subunit C